MNIKVLVVILCVLHLVSVIILLENIIYFVTNVLLLHSLSVKNDRARQFRLPLNTLDTLGKFSGHTCDSHHKLREWFAFLNGECWSFYRLPASSLSEGGGLWWGDLIIILSLSLSKQHYCIYSFQTVYVNFSYSWNLILLSSTILRLVFRKPRVRFLMCFRET